MKASIKEASATAQYAETRAESAVFSREATSEARHVAKLAEAAPDVREEIVASLRARIESGSYYVGAESIAERMMEYALANRS